MSAIDEARLALDNLRDRVWTLGTPTLRLGVTGLSRAGKTVFITALVRALTVGARLPMFEAHANGRIARVRLAPQPDDGVPRFGIEEHTDMLIREREWPASTRAIAQLRLVIEFETEGLFGVRRRRLALDIVDYPGEWLLDLPLLSQSYAEFSQRAFDLARGPARAALATDWLADAAGINPDGPVDEARAADLHASFTAYLRACRDDDHAFSTLPPGRFLMPGDLDGSPALTFSPLPPRPEPFTRDTFGGLMERRFEAYKDVVVRPFYRNHFARLDRQIVLVDALQASNAGPEAVRDLQRALSEIMSSFRPGRTNAVSALFARRVDRLMIAATKADHLHRGDHDKLEGLVRLLVEQATDRAEDAGAEVRYAALGAVRATREARDGEGEDALPLIVGTPIEGERVDGRVFDGQSEVAIFPGDMPSDPHAVLNDDLSGAIRFVRFRPPESDATKAPLPSIRLDRVLQFLVGDRLE